LNTNQKLITVYNILLGKFGNRHWWPAQSPFEMMVGAILTQNVSWKNATKAISNLKKANLLDPETMARSHPEKLATLLIPARFMNLKARRLKTFSKWYISEFSADIQRMSKTRMQDLRERLLEVDGIGKETADCILLYACDMPIFVVDAYTLRVFGRLGLVKGKPSYDELQAFFMQNLPEEVILFKDYHAQIVHLGKEVCRQKPLCGRCPLRHTGDDLHCLTSVKTQQDENHQAMS
jgi:endonuclease-3 related protein